jgi:hypothetical protein
LRRELSSREHKQLVLSRCEEGSMRRERFALLFG